MNPPGHESPTISRARTRVCRNDSGVRIRSAGGTARVHSSFPDHCSCNDPVASRDRSGADSATLIPDGTDPLVQILVSKGILTSSDAVTLQQSCDPRVQLLMILRNKGTITTLDYDALTNPPASAQVSGALVASATPMVPASTVPAPEPVKPEVPKVIPAVAPMRVLQLETSNPNGMIPDIKLVSGANVKIYGLVKASSIYDSSSPYGTDMPLPGFINVMTTNGAMAFDPGPTGGSEFHIKARFLRLGTNFEWPEISKNTSVTGKLEFDFAGNFTRSLNRNVSTIRSSQASIRLAYGRIDHRFNERTSIFGLFGQDWTPFGSSTLPALYESTGLGLGFGTLYERAPQFRFGVGHKLDSSRNLFIQPETAIVMPAYGNDPKSMDNQMGYGERQGADSGRPEIQGRFVFQWQIDKARSVVPAQFIVSAVEGKRTALVRTVDVPLCTAAVPACPASTADPPNPIKKSFRTPFPRAPKSAAIATAGPPNCIAHPLRHPDHEILEWCRPALVSRGKLVLDLQRPRGAREHRIHRGSTIQRRHLFGSFRFPQRSPRACAPAPLRAQGGFVNVGFPYRDCSMRMPAAETPDGRSTCTTLWTWRMLRTSANWAISDRRTTSPPPRLISS